MQAGSGDEGSYLQSIGVLSKHQGGKEKFGSTMLRFLQQAATSMNVPIYLETESKKNEPMYQHFGFKTLEKMPLYMPGDKRNDATLVVYLMQWAPPNETD